MLLTFIIAVIVGFVAYLVAGVIPYLAPYKDAIGLLVAIVYFLVNSGLVR